MADHRMENMNIKHIVLLFGSLIFIMLACAPKVRYGVLSTFFDGVPLPEDERYELTVGKDTLGQTDSTRIAAVMKSVREVKFQYHEPYREKKCSSCHEEKRMGRLVIEEPELCYQCHESAGEAKSYRHGPSDAGYCTSCHRPHMSKSDNLLYESGKALCYGCHEEVDVSDNIIHKDIKKNNCVSCHDPHSSENDFMLQRGTCFNCHDDFTGDYSFMHGPVSAGYCSVCHGSHESENKYLLVKAGKDLCLNCHDATTIFMNEKHQGDNKEDCTSCHNPHGGENEFMLN